MHCIHRLFAFILLAAAVALPAAAKPVAEAPTGAEAPLVLFNRTIFVFRSDFFGQPPALRAARAATNLEAILDKGGELAVSLKGNPEGQLVMVDDAMAFAVIAGDVDPLTQETPQQVAARAARALEAVIAETREARDLEVPAQSSRHLRAGDGDPGPAAARPGLDPQARADLSHRVGRTEG